jgi:putative peptidoglycan lipid II flippase
VSGFTAKQDTKTPVRYGIYSMMASLLLNGLAIPLAHAGLALATSLGAFINAGLLLRQLRKNNSYQPAKGWGLFSLRLVFANSVLFALLYYGVDESLWYSWDSMQRAGHLMQWVILGIISYSLSLLITGLNYKHFK